MTNPADHPASNRNSVRHGLAAEFPQSKDEAHRLRILTATFTARLRPADDVEKALVRHAAASVLRLERCEEAERAVEGPNLVAALRDWERDRRHAVRRRAQSLGERLESGWEITYNGGRRCVAPDCVVIRSRRARPMHVPEIPLTSEQEQAADRLYQTLRSACDDELRRIARLLASKPDDQLLGRAEFEVRDRVHAIGAKAIEAALNERKKGATRAPA